MTLLRGVLNAGQVPAGFTANKDSFLFWESVVRYWFDGYPHLKPKHDGALRFNFMNGDPHSLRFTAGVTSPDVVGTVNFATSPFDGLYPSSFKPKYFHPSFVEERSVRFAVKPIIFDIFLYAPVKYESGLTVEVPERVWDALQVWFDERMADGSLRDK
jgi:hypothetical protein